MRKIKSKRVKAARMTTHKAGTSSKTLKGILKDAGFSDTAIERMARDGKLFITPANLRGYLRAGEELYVLDPNKESQTKNTTVDRFLQLDLE